MTAPRPGHGRRPAPVSPSSDLTRANVFIVLGSLAALASMYWSMLFAMAGDSCPDNCRHPDLFMGLAYGVSWGGIAAALVITVRGMAAARRSGRPTWTWPALSIGLIVLTAIAGALLADAMIIVH